MILTCVLPVAVQGMQLAAQPLLAGTGQQQAFLGQSLFALRPMQAPQQVPGVVATATGVPASFTTIKGAGGKVSSGCRGVCVCCVGVGVCGGIGVCVCCVGVGVLCLVCG
jgi:hypothetical protein